MIAENIKDVTQRIANSCKKTGRSPGDVAIVCVTKTVSVTEIEEVLRAGLRLLGENRVQDASGKYAVIGNKAEWHLVGHLQTNKARDAVRIFSLIHSVDSIRLARQLDKEAGRIGKIQDMLIQVNISGEASKFGVDPEEAEGLIREASLLPNIRIIGLMTIAPEAEDSETVRPYFRALRELKDKINEERNTKDKIRLLSMGMTGDFEVAVEEGSNIVRIGRAIFG